MDFISGGVCAPKGFKASGVHCGIRKNKSKRDLALIYSEAEAAAAAVYTKNLVKGAPILVTKKNLSDGRARAVICNSGNANTCNADGVEIAEAMCRLLADELKISPADVIVASTGVIGQPLPIEPIKNGIKPLVAALGNGNSALAAEAIMTTDTALKEVAATFEIDGKTCTVGGIAKGSGMINPNMATMLVFITTDAAITPEMLTLALKEDVKDSFNMISVDGDTSTNDMVSVMANGTAQNKLIDKKNAAYRKFKEALFEVTKYLCRAIAKDGEGATKLIECRVFGAASKKTARTVAKAVISSSLVKSAIFGADANWGRILCAAGYSGADIDVEKVDVSFESSAGAVAVCKSGASIDFDEPLAKAVLSESEIIINVKLNAGKASATAWGCDLTEAYVKINSGYRT
ncbi:MAG: bifunctional glutamate N-acetyltransferase/amino-acid acetyltransferase ArgJ [Christensenellales bacterium]|jgi:glutamate N-acetyltransferase/amino-acid N-acetyltransferase|nr:bifunctional glutamate N-acetyltransferase/amino-acid acetyltransferase ArgJ [Clostridia bacterium]HRU83947.1 bifunctional glutamate N-acetyltransferase/amino-acid acetyltransferase ArgJ [Eubacteriales bacterium]